MWTCPECNRIFARSAQPHSCEKVPLEEHFHNKETAKGLFDSLLKELNANVGKCKIISIPCCVHLFGKYDFLAALPKKDNLEIRFALDRPLKGPRIRQTVQMTKNSYKNCMDINSGSDINDELIKWLKEAYYLKG